MNTSLRRFKSPIHRIKEIICSALHWQILVRLFLFGERWFMQLNCSTHLPAVQSFQHQGSALQLYARYFFIFFLEGGGCNPVTNSYLGWLSITTLTALNIWSRTPWLCWKSSWCVTWWAGLQRNPALMPWNPTGQELFHLRKTARFQQINWIFYAFLSINCTYNKMNCLTSSLFHGRRV